VLGHTERVPTPFPFEVAVHRFAIAFLISLTACASGSSGAKSLQDPAPSSVSKVTISNAFVITTDEISAANLPTAYDLVDRLRHAWLRPDAVTGGAVLVYADNQNIGAAEKLRDIPSTTISELQFLSNRDAVARWGATIQGSVIVVTRR
jgi:hypothetical protein